VQRIKGTLLQLRFLILGYAIFDVVRTGIATYYFITEAVSEGVQVVGPMHFMASSFLFLIAAGGCFIRRPWSYSVAIGASVWLLFRGIIKWEAITLAQFPEIPMWSSAALKYWWMYGGGEWDFPRFILSGIMMVYALAGLLQARAGHASNHPSLER
jgi:hypothetical protein